MLLEKPMPQGWEFVQQVVVMQLGEIADVIMSGPVLRTLKQALPDSTIALLTAEAASQVVSYMPWVDECLVHDITSWSDSKASSSFIEKLRSHKFDAAVILPGMSVSGVSEPRVSESPYPLAYCCYLAGIPLRLGHSQEFGGGVLSQWVKSLPDAHPIDRNLFLLESAGFVIGDRSLELQVPAPIQPQVKQLLQRLETRTPIESLDWFELLTQVKQVAQSASV